MKRRDRKSTGHQSVTNDSAPQTASDGPLCGIEPKKNYWYFALLLVALVAPFATILAFPGGRVIGNPRCDNPSAYYFINYFAAQCWRHWTVPLWNPYIMLGIPFVGEGQASVFHPLSFLFVLLPTGAAINWLIACSFTLTGAFFYGYLRALGLGRPAAWCGAVAWSFSNVMISRIYAGHLNILLTLISMPLIMMLWEKYRAGGRVQCLVGIAVAYALMILAYYPWLLYIFSLFFLGYVVIQSAQAVRDRATAWREGRAILLLGCFILLGIGLGAIQLFPSLDFVSKSFRQQASIGFCGTFSFVPENLLTLIAPRFFGTAVTIPTRLYWGRYNFWETWIYLGILPLIMAAVGAWAAPRQRRVTLVSLACIFFVLGLGNNTPLFPLTYKYMPGYGIFRGHGKNMIMTLFCLATFSAYGFESLFSEANEFRRRRARRIAYAAGAVLFLAAVTTMLGLLRHPATPGSAWHRFFKWVQFGDLVKDPIIALQTLRMTADNAAGALWRAMALIGVSLALVALLQTGFWRRCLFPVAGLLVLADLLGIFLPLLKTYDESITSYPPGFREHFQSAIGEYPYPPRILNPNPIPNIAIRYGYSSPFGYVGNTLRRYNDFLCALQGINRGDSLAESQLQNFTPEFWKLAFDAIVVDPKRLPPGAKTIGQMGDKVMVPFDQVQQKLPRAFLASAPRYFAQREAALNYVFLPGTNVQASPAIERQGGQLAAAPLEANESVRFVSYNIHRIVLEVRANRPRELVLCGMFERNWTARVNGRRAEVEPANYVFRAVQVPAGVSRVVFKYHPLPFYWGVAVSALALAILLGIGAGTLPKPLQLRGAWAAGLLAAIREWLARHGIGGHHLPGGLHHA